MYLTSVLHLCATCMGSRASALCAEVCSVDEVAGLALS